MEHPFLSQPDAKDDGGFVTADPFANPGTNSAKSAQHHEAPPPPYESVVMNDGEVPSIGPSLRQVNTAPSSNFQIVVTDPVKHGDSVGWRRLQAYVSYKLQTRTNQPQYKNKESEVIRRFRDFAWLNTRLQEQNRGIIVPALPEKNAVQKYQMNADFIEQRRRALQVYINRVAAHPTLQGTSVLQQFLEASEEDWSLEMSRAGSTYGSRPTTGTPKGRLDRTIQLFKELSHTTASLVQGKHDEDEDEDYLKVKDYILELESHMAETHRQASKLIKRQGELGLSLGEFGSSLMVLGKFEQSALADHFVNIGEKSQKLAKQSQEQAESLLVSFEAPLKEFVRLVKSAKAVMNDRSAALQAVHLARSELESKRNKLAKLRGVAGIKEEKISEAERELNDAAKKVETATKEYEEIVTRMSEDLARFQRERADELAMVMRNFAVSQAQLAAETARIWREHLGDISTNGST